VDDRRAEDGDDGIADELLDRAAETLQLGADARVVPTEQRAHVFGVQRLSLAREADEVAEDDGDHLALAASGVDAQGCSATGAEVRIVCVLPAAARAQRHRSRTRRSSSAFSAAASSGTERRPRPSTGVPLLRRVA
jgi:hypothetical protein